MTLKYHGNFNFEFSGFFVRRASKNPRKLVYSLRFSLRCKVAFSKFSEIDIHGNLKTERRKHEYTIRDC